MAIKKNKQAKFEDEDLARIHNRAEKNPSDEEEDEAHREEDEFTRIQRRAEMIPSDDEGSFDGTSKAGNLCEFADGSSDDGSSDDGDDYNDDDDDGNAKQMKRNTTFSSREDEEDETSSDEEVSSRKDMLGHARPLNEIPLHERLELKLNGSDQNPYTNQRNMKKPPKSDQWHDTDFSYYQPQQPQQKKPKKTKHAPMELSTKWAVGRHREVIPTKKVRVRDPRFEEMSSTLLTGKAVEDAYDFINEKRKTELQKLHSEIRKERKKRGGRAGGTDSKIEILKAAELRLKQVEYESARKRSEKSALTAWKQQEKASVAAGKQPFYLKRKAAKELLLEARFDGIRKGKGGKKRVEKILERKRKKAIANERKWLPEERRT